MSPLDAVLVKAVLFLLRRYAVTVGWAPDDQPLHRDDPKDSRDCECEACVLVAQVEQEAR